MGGLLKGLAKVLGPVVIQAAATWALGKVDKLNKPKPNT